MELARAVAEVPDAGQHKRIGARERVRIAHQLGARTDGRERLANAREIPDAVIDDGDHACLRIDPRVTPPATASGIVMSIATASSQKGVFCDESRRLTNVRMVDSTP